MTTLADMTPEECELLYEATTGPWRIDQKNEPVIVGPRKIESGFVKDPVLGYLESAEDTELAALAPELLAEVIRLREELTSLRDDLKEDGEKVGATASEMEEFATCGRIAKQLTRILEGDDG